MNASAHGHSHTEPGGEPPRRNFLIEFAALIIGGVITMVPLAMGAVFALNPLLKKKAKGAAKDDAVATDGFIRVGNAQILVDGGPPMLFRVIGTKVDAWTTYPAANLGAVYIRRREDGSLQAFNARCTHLGCMVNFQPDLSEYVCPCHASSFKLNGERSNKIPPRDMDPLEVELRNEDELWVKFQNFRGGREQRIPV